MVRKAPLPSLLAAGALLLAGCGETLFSQSVGDDEGSRGNSNSNNNTSNANTSGNQGNDNRVGAADAGVAPPPSSSDAGASGDGGTSDGGVVVPIFNPYVEVAHDPFSTFAADVDSASYDIFAKSMEEGAGLPAPTTVRSEEFVNYFAYDYPPADLQLPDPFAIDLDVGLSPAGDNYLLRVGIQGKDLLADRPPANLVFLVDSSCSMSAADKLPLAQEMLRSALGMLRADDQVSLVTYAGSTRVALPVTEVRQRAVIEAAISSLGARGGTAGADGLQLAYDQATAGFVPGGVNHIILCTDGDFNIGPHTTTELVQIVEDRRRTGVTFTALGFGRGNLNDEMMERISNAGNGIYRVISGLKTAQRYVSQKLLSDVVHIAKDVKLQVEFNPDHVLAYRQVGYENRQLADSDFRNDVVDAGEIGSGHQMTALYELVLVGGEVPAPEGAPALVTGAPVDGAREVQAHELVRVKVRYKQPGASATDPATEMTASLGPDAVGTLHAESEYAWAVATLAGRMAHNPFVSAQQMTVAGPILGAVSEPDRLGLALLYQEAEQLLPR